MEPSLGIIAGCIATLRPLFKAWGFGPNSSSAQTSSGSKSAVSRSARWRQSRGMYKLNDERTSRANPRAKPKEYLDVSDSAIKLVSSVHPNSFDHDTSIKSWEVDLERGQQGRVTTGRQLPTRTTLRHQTSRGVMFHAHGSDISYQGVTRPPPVHPTSGRRVVVFSGQHRTVRTQIRGSPGHTYLP